MGKINILEHSVALKIAAGEVIDRPASVLRELIDNSIDAGSTEITVEIHGSGMKEIRVTDNGSGMDREDLGLCTKPHATSKIIDSDDLFRIRTLGFRGEALAGIAASSRLTITTCDGKSDSALTLRSDLSGNIDIFTDRGNPGTTVSVKDLFSNLPARKKFLKSPSAESSLCRNVFFEKAAARPDIAFRLYSDGNPVSLMTSSSLSERIFLSYTHVFRDRSLIYEIDEYKNEEQSYSIKGILADPECFRKDRKFIHIYLNGRRIQDYSLLQAVVYGYSGFMPGGHFPAAFIFIENDPALVDFNVHPAKKEARIKNTANIHHSLSEAVKETIAANVMPAARRPDKTGAGFRDTVLFPENPPATSLTTGPDTDSDTFRSTVARHYGESLNRNSYFPHVAETSTIEIGNDSDSPVNVPADRHAGSAFRYLGQLFRTFLLCERDDSLFIIDQHAAHEKSLYESFCAKPPAVQKLLVPIYLHEDTVLDSEMMEKYRKTGIYIEKDDTGSLFIDSLPSFLGCIKNNIAEIIASSPGNSDQVLKKLYSTASCKMAVKGGDILSPPEAEAIIDAAFNLDSPYCPHGRPVWKEITRKQLFEDIERIV